MWVDLEYEKTEDTRKSLDFDIQYYKQAFKQMVISGVEHSAHA